jgi:hypothetical protein
MIVSLFDGERQRERIAQHRAPHFDPFLQTGEGVEQHRIPEG